MSNENKNILITPNRGSPTDDPKIEFVGADSNTTAETVAIIAKPDSDGTISFEAGANQLFSVTNNLTGTVFSVNDADGVPIMEADADGTVRLAEFGGRVGIGVSEPLSALDINATDAITLPRGTSAQRPANPIGGMMRYNTDFNSVEWYDAVGQQWNSMTGVIATGGAVTEITQDGVVYRVHTFTDVGTSSFQVLRGGEVEYLIVGGGGAGGNNHAGGGGGGGLLEGVLSINSNNYSVIVGAGGQPHELNSTATSEFNDGGNSSVFGIPAAGGGGGGHRNDSANTSPGRNGGSGGGGGGSQNTFPDNRIPGSGIFGQGNSGGSAIDLYGGGGGGAGAEGNAGTGLAFPSGVGGVGKSSSITGTMVFYAGGGGGSSGSASYKASGGAGGGGAAGGAINDNGTAGTNGLGGGGGGGGAGGTPGSAGGSGIVIIRYPIGRAAA
jgi:hypothetical protein